MVIVRPACERFLRALTARRWRGLGDVVALATTMIGVPPCDGCATRQRALNEWFPFGREPSDGAPGIAPPQEIEGGLKTAR